MAALFRDASRFVHATQPPAVMTDQTARGAAELAARLEKALASPSVHPGDVEAARGFLHYFAQVILLATAQKGRVQ
jgi:hypothetical protein